MSPTFKKMFWYALFVATFVWGYFVGQLNERQMYDAGKEVAYKQVRACLQKHVGRVEAWTIAGVGVRFFPIAKGGVYEVKMLEVQR